MIKNASCGETQVSSDTHRFGGENQISSSHNYSCGENQTSYDQMIKNASCNETQISSDTIADEKSLMKEKITDYFRPEPIGERKESLEFRDIIDMKYYSEKGQLSRNLTQSIKNNCFAGMSWHKVNKRKEEERKNKAQRVYKSIVGKTVPKLQEDEFVFIGADVCALYPSLDQIETAVITAHAVKESNIFFQDISYDELSVYLALTIGKEGMAKWGVGHCFPRKLTDDNQMSLNSKVNRNLINWECMRDVYSKEDKKNLLSAMVHVATLLLMQTSCYSFGGRIFLQKKGSGIGLRASACIAKLVMAVWDRLWSEMQMKSGLKVHILMRYIDDLRAYLRAIPKGWKWVHNGWCYEEDSNDLRDSETRTKQELQKSFDSIFSFLSFTTEGQQDFEEGYMPTLDTQTKVDTVGLIRFKHYTKPMASNLTLHRDTALSKTTVFSSIRQDLCRRLLNTSRLEEDITFKKIVEEYIQVLSNSGHQFSFIKAAVLQAITRFKFMEERNRLPPDHPKYRPLYRDRQYKRNERLITKRVQMATWFTGEDLGDPWRQSWKSRIKRKGSNKGEKIVEVTKDVVNKEITTTIFVPASKNSLLFQMIQEKEESLKGQLSWGVKVLEKGGIPIASLLTKKFPMKSGCPLGEGCQACDGDGIVCGVKGVVYQATCLDCSTDNSDKKAPTYIGESSRLMRVRTAEHMTALERLNRKSFQLQHWMTSHGTSPFPPRFKFKVLENFKDPLSRQLCEALEIMHTGNLNQKTEFKINDLCRLVTESTEKEKEAEVAIAKFERDTLDLHLDSFINVMRNVINKETSRQKRSSNPCNAFRQKTKRRGEEETGLAEKEKRKRRRMDSSTPKFQHYRLLEETSPDQISPIPRENSPLQVDPEVFEYELSGDEPAKTRKKTEVSNDFDHMEVTQRKDDSSTTEKKNLFNTTKLIEQVLRERGLIKRSVSVGEIVNMSRENVFYGKMKTRASPRTRSLSLTGLVGEMTINNWNSGSSFEEENIGTDAAGGIQTVDVGVDGVTNSWTPSRPKRQLSPDELTPVGRNRKMSTEICNSPILRMRYEYWDMEEMNIAEGIVGIAPVDREAHINPPTTVGGRYGLVGKLNGATTGEIRYGLVAEPGDTNSGPTVEAGDTLDWDVARVIKTPRRRLASASVFERMMMNTSQLERNRSRSVSSRPRRGRISTTPSSQKLISTFLTPKRGK